MTTLNASLSLSSSKLDVMTLLKKYQASHKSEILQLLFESCQDMVMSAAYKYFFKDADTRYFDLSLKSLKREDLENALRSESFIPFVRACDKYDFDRNVAFSSFLGTTMYFYFLDLKRKNAVHSHRYAVESALENAVASENKTMEIDDLGHHASYNDRCETQDFRVAAGVYNDGTDSKQSSASDLLNQVRSYVGEDSKTCAMMDALLGGIQDGRRDYASYAAQKMGYSRQYLNKAVKAARAKLRKTKLAEDVDDYFGA